MSLRLRSVTGRLSSGVETQDLYMYVKGTQEFKDISFQVEHNMNIPRQAVYDFLMQQEQHLSPSESDRRERERYFNSACGRIHQLVNLIDYRKGMKILEIGASPFFASQVLIHFLHLQPTDFIMIDGTTPCDTTVTKSSQTLLGQDFALFKLNAETTLFPFEDETFDYIICQDVIEHLIYDPLFLVHESNRVLKKGGVLILSTSPAVFSWFITLRYLLNRPVEMGYHIHSCNPYARHNRLFSLNEVQQMVSGNGFKVLAAFNTTHWYRVDQGMSFKARCYKRGVYLLDKITEGLAQVIPFFREKAGMQLWVIAEKYLYLDKSVYPPGLDLTGEFTRGSEE